MSPRERKYHRRPAALASLAVLGTFAEAAFEQCAAFSGANARQQSPRPPCGPHTLIARSLRPGPPPYQRVELEEVALSFKGGARPSEIGVYSLEIGGGLFLLRCKLQKVWVILRLYGQCRISGGQHSDDTGQY